MLLVPPPTLVFNALYRKKHLKSSKVMSDNRGHPSLLIMPSMLLVTVEFTSVPLGLPGVLWVLPDSYIDVKNKDYGG